MKGIYLTVVLFLYTNVGKAQNTGFYHETSSLSVAPDTIYHVTPTQRPSAIAVRYPEGQSAAKSFIVVESDTFQLVPDEHVMPISGWVTAQLITFPKTERTISFYSGELKGGVDVHFISAGTIKPIHLRQTIEKSSNNCDEPATIDQEVWRSGLPEPNYSRVYTNVKHVIVHHSAGSNSNTDYTQVVRDIYLYHTQVNGWSDIGYNYLIAQDGTLFKGRDPLSGEQDNVQGAHFCGMNSNTMGVCLLGTYTSVAPSTATETALFDLVAWKLHKEQLNPKEAFPFNSIPSLNVLSGHRDGCATACPGELTYDRLPFYVQTVYERWAACNGQEALIADFDYFPLEIEEGESIQFTDLSTGNPSEWEWYFESGRPAFVNSQRPPAIQYLYAGKFDVKLRIANGNGADSILLTDAIVVRKKRYPIVAPNPVRVDNGFTIYFEAEALTHQLLVYTALGVKCDERYSTTGEVYFETANWRAGLYFVHVRTATSDKVIPITLF